jgi:DNA-repair protein complementing XP-A cells
MMMHLLMLTALRMSVRSSLYDRTNKSSHEHQFGPETYNEADDTYTHTCITCNYAQTFEKM